MLGASERPWIQARGSTWITSRAAAVWRWLGHRTSIEHGRIQAVTNTHARGERSSTVCHTGRVVDEDHRPQALCVMLGYSAMKAAASSFIEELHLVQEPPLRHRLNSAKQIHVSICR